MCIYDTYMIYMYKANQLYIYVSILLYTIYSIIYNYLLLLYIILYI